MSSPALLVRVVLQRALTGISSIACWDVNNVLPASVCKSELALLPASEYRISRTSRSRPPATRSAAALPRLFRWMNSRSIATRIGAAARPSLAKMKKVRLRDLADAPFVWFPRREAPAFYDRLLHECFRGGLKSPRIVQEALNEATILSLVSHGMGVA